MKVPFEGGCLCGEVRWRAEAVPTAIGYCHCRMCQRIGGAPAQVWANLPASAVTFSKPPAAYRSSDWGERLFCPTCGSSLAFRLLSDEPVLGLNVGTFDHPEDAKPTLHIFTASQLPWFHPSEELPHYPDLAPDGG